MKKSEYYQENEGSFGLYPIPTGGPQWSRLFFMDWLIGWACLHNELDYSPFKLDNALHINLSASMFHDAVPAYMMASVWRSRRGPIEQYPATCVGLTDNYSGIDTPYLFSQMIYLAIGSKKVTRVVEHTREMFRMLMSGRCDLRLTTSMSDTNVYVTQTDSARLPARHDVRGISTETGNIEFKTHLAPKETNYTAEEFSDIMLKMAYESFHKKHPHLYF